MTNAPTATASVCRRDEVFLLLFYAVLLLVTLSTFTATFINYPLFPLQTNSLAWSNAWLLASVIDYYGTCLCFCGVVVASEDAWWSAVLWVIGCCTVGSPACCLYVFLWLTKEGGTLRLERSSSSLPPPRANSDESPCEKTVVQDDTTVDTESRLPSPTYSDAGRPRHHTTATQQQLRYPPQQYRHHHNPHQHHRNIQDVERAIIS